MLIYTIFELYKKLNDGIVQRLLFTGVYICYCPKRGQYLKHSSTSCTYNFKHFAIVNNKQIYYFENIVLELFIGKHGHIVYNMYGKKSLGGQYAGFIKKSIINKYKMINKDEWYTVDNIYDLLQNGKTYFIHKTNSRPT